MARRARRTHSPANRPLAELAQYDVSAGGSPWRLSIKVDVDFASKPRRRRLPPLPSAPDFQHDQRFAVRKCGLHRGSFSRPIVYVRGRFGPACSAGVAHGFAPITIDGKILRRSFDRTSGKSVLHMVSVWGCEPCMALVQPRIQ